MKVNGIHQGKVGNLEGNKEVLREKNVSQSGGKAQNTRDGKSVSESARTVSRARVEADKSTDVREERIAQVEARLKAGDYESKEVKDELASRLTRKLKQLLRR